MNKTILVVDDDIDIQVQMKAILDAQNFNPIITGGILQAREMLKEQSVDLILLDVMMRKDSDGFNFAQELKGDDRYKNIPIIMVTSVNQKMPFEFGTDSDGDFLPVEKFMEKPVDPEALVNAINELV